MKIQLAPGQKLTIGFYVPKEQQKDRGWRQPEDQPLDGEFTIEFGDEAIIVKADLPDDEDRGSDDAPIYYASFGSDEAADVEATDEDE